MRFLIAILILWSVPALAQTQFFSALDDVPLMQGLTELPELSVTFDKPEGRFVQTVARIDGVSHEAVMAYYKGVLPQFGWRSMQGDIFLRRDEQLGFSFEDQSHVKLTLSPR